MLMVSYYNALEFGTNYRDPRCLLYITKLRLSYCICIVICIGDKNYRSSSSVF
jgi:hypothetical protein